MNNNYEIGYKKPPKNGQFKPGQSGNGKGRPKGHRNIKTDLLEELMTQISVTENGRSKKMSKQAVFIKQVCTKALGGDLASGKLLITLMQKYIVEEPETLQEEHLSEQDQDLLDNYVKNLR